MRDAKNISPDAIAQWERMEYLRERRVSSSQYKDFQQ